MGKRAEGFDRAASGAHLCAHELDVLAQLPAALGDLPLDTAKCPLDGHTRVDADNQKIEQVREGLPVAADQKSLPAAEISIGAGKSDQRGDQDHQDLEEGGD